MANRILCPGSNTYDVGHTSMENWYGVPGTSGVGFESDVRCDPRSHARVTSVEVVVIPFELTSVICTTKSASVVSADAQKFTMIGPVTSVGSDSAGVVQVTA